MHNQRMPEFLVHIEVRWPPGGDPRERERLVDAERTRAQELTDAGTIRRLWRIPGRWANWGIWSTESVGHLHDAIESLPLRPYLEVIVHPLAPHPSDPGLG